MIKGMGENSNIVHGVVVENGNSPHSSHIVDQSAMLHECYNIVCWNTKLPNVAVASLDSGRRVLTSSGIDVVALDHDFTKAKFIPSIALAINIPDSITESFYQDKVFVGVKDAVFSPSSSLMYS